MRASSARLRGALTELAGAQQRGAHSLPPRSAARPPQHHIVSGRRSAQNLAPKRPAIATALAAVPATWQVPAAGAAGAAGGLPLELAFPRYPSISPTRLSTALATPWQTIRGATGPQRGRHLQVLLMHSPQACRTPGILSGAPSGVPFRVEPVLVKDWVTSVSISRTWVTPLSSFSGGPRNPCTRGSPGRAPNPLQLSACTLLNHSSRSSSSSSSYHNLVPPTGTPSVLVRCTDVIYHLPEARFSARASSTSSSKSARRHYSTSPAFLALDREMAEEGHSRAPESALGTGARPLLATEARNSAPSGGYDGGVSVAELSLGPGLGALGASSGTTLSTAAGAASGIPPVSVSGDAPASGSASASALQSGTPPAMATASCPGAPPAPPTSSASAFAATGAVASGSGEATAAQGTASTAQGSGTPPPEDPIVQHVVMRRDLAEKDGLGWPLGSIIAQGCHASVAAIWESQGEPLAQRYMADLDNMRKVVLEVKNESQLRELSKKLTAGGIPHKLWIEQPENVATCLATQPNLKSVAAPFFKKLRLCK